MELCIIVFRLQCLIYDSPRTSFLGVCQRLHFKDIDTISHICVQLKWLRQDHEKLHKYMILYDHENYVMYIIMKGRDFWCAIVGKPSPSHVSIPWQTKIIQSHFGPTICLCNRLILSPIWWHRDICASPIKLPGICHHLYCRYMFTVSHLTSSIFPICLLTYNIVRGNQQITPPEYK